MAPGSSEESLGSRLDLTSLAQEWDSDPELRGRWRDGGSFLHPDTPAGEDIKGCCLNRMLLVPLLTRMAVSEKRVLPSIHDLHAAVESALTLNKRPPKPEDYEGLMAVAWRVRFMAGFVKMKVRRSEVSQVEDFQQLCLLLEPTRLAALEAEQEEDEYDDGPSGSGLDHREECLEEENGESGPGVEQEQSPSNEPTPKASGSETGECKQETSNPPPTNSTLGAPSSSSTTPAMPPPTGSKAELEALREKVRQKLEELKKKKAEETTNSSPPVTSKGDAACPRGPDNIETQPVDITCTSPPVEPPAPEASPPCPVEIASKSVVLSGEIGSHQRCVVNGGSGLRSPS